MYTYATRPYQADMINYAREAVRNGSVCHFLQAGTGTGKSRVIAEMSDRLAKSKKRVWIVVPRNNLVWQMAEHLAEINLPHGIIDAKHQEKPQYLTHVISKDSLIRRYDKIKNWPDYIFFDEAHLYLDKQIEIWNKAGNPYVFGFSATPERLDGRGLSRKSGGLYDSISYAPSIKWMMDADYLCKLRYFSIPINGLTDLHVKGNDYDAEELDTFLKKNHIYGDVISHYEKYGKGRSALIFTRSVKSAYEVAKNFRDSGYKFECIEGSMGKKIQHQLLDRMKSGEIQGLVSADILTYGTDIPRVSYAASIRPTLSKALFFQMIGRILRLFAGKKDTIFCDHVGLLTEHSDSSAPGVPPFYLDHIDWNFDGDKKRSRKIKDCFTCKYCEVMPNKPLKCLLFGKKVSQGTDGTAKDCPKYVKFGQESLKICTNPSCDHCYEYYTETSCPYCGEAKKRKAQALKEIEGELVELAPVALGELPPEEKREMQDRILSARESRSVGNMLKIAEELGYRWQWAYNQIVDPDAYMVDMQLLHNIREELGWKPGSIYFMKKNVEKHHNRRKAESELNKNIGIGGLFV